jgi:hypothetical protein
MAIRHTVRRWLTAGAACAMLAGSAVGGSAAASAANYGPDTVVGHGYAPGHWAGYVNTLSTYSAVMASWQVPAVTCRTTNDVYAPWVGLDGYGDKTVEQTGVQIWCQNGAGHPAVYQAFYELYPAQPVYLTEAIAPGDVIVARVDSLGAREYRFTITDRTRRWTKVITDTSSVPTTNASAEAVVESPSGTYPGFTSQKFSDIWMLGTHGWMPMGIGGIPLTGASTAGDLVPSSPQRLLLTNTFDVTEKF